MTAPKVTAWSGTPGLLSEGPRWHGQRQELLSVDILGRHVHRGTLTPNGALDRVETISIDRHIGAVAPAIGGGYVPPPDQGFCLSMTPVGSTTSPSPKPTAPTCG